MSLARRAPLFVVLFCASTAHADPTAEDKAQADAFFREGRALMNQGKFSDACGKFGESQRLDPAPGTLMNLALCHEKEGKTASAWAELNEVADRPGDDLARGPFARAHAAEIEKRLSRLRVRVERPTPSEIVTIDGRPHGASAWGSAMPLDPGDHVLDATASTKSPWHYTVHIDPGPVTLEVLVPALTDAEAARREPARPVETPPPPPAPADDGAPTNRGRTIGFIVGGVGIASILVGSYFGVRTLSKKSDADALCPNNKCAGDPNVASLDDDARTSATISTIGFGVGIASLAVGTYLVLTSHPDPGKPSRAITVVPSAYARGGGAVLAGWF